MLAGCPIKYIIHFVYWFLVHHVRSTKNVHKSSWLTK